MKDLDQTEKSKKERFLIILNELEEAASQLEHDLNYSADHYGSEYLFQACKHARSIYHLVKKEINNRDTGNSNE